MSLNLHIPALQKLLNTDSLPCGYVYEIYGEENSGKTSMALQFILAAQQDPHAVCVFIDGEHSIADSHLSVHQVDTTRLHILQPETLDDALNIVEASVRERIARLIVIDGLNAMPSALELSESLGNYSRRSETAAARLITKSFQSLIGHIWDQQTTILVLNQIRHKPNFDGSVEEFVPGGRLLPILSPLRLRMGNAVIQYADGLPQNFSAEISVTRNRFAPTLGTIRATFPFVS